MKLYGTRWECSGQDEGSKGEMVRTCEQKVPVRRCETFTIAGVKSGSRSKPKKNWGVGE